MIADKWCSLWAPLTLSCAVLVLRYLFALYVVKAAYTYPVLSW